MKLSIKYILPCLVAALSLASCDDWTDVEGLDIIDPTIENTNPELYAQYLAALRQYKESDHKKTYAWFDNSVKITYSRAHHVSDVPDSVDVISLMSPADIMDTELAEIKQVREQKGTRFVYDIDFDAIRADYNSYVELFAAENPDSEQSPIAFNDYLLDAIDTQLTYCSRYELDGICFRFTGKHTLHLTKDELNEYISQASIFAGYLRDWHKRNADKMLVFAGKPQNVIDKSLFDECEMVFVSDGLDATNVDLFSYYLTLAQQDGVPTEKLGMMAACTSLDENDLKSGWFSDGSRALASLGDWAATHNVAGIGIYNISSDYFNNTYSFSRAAIQAISPAVK
ncbi:MAG: glycoside hydrolase family 18 [Muribaculaceae bacterium]